MGIIESTQPSPEAELLPLEQLKGHSVTKCVCVGDSLDRKDCDRRFHLQVNSTATSKAI